jgi:hypothetical protein
LALLFIADITMCFDIGFTFVLFSEGTFTVPAFPTSTGKLHHFRVFFELFASHAGVVGDGCALLALLGFALPSWAGEPVFRVVEGMLFS